MTSFPGYLAWLLRPFFVWWWTAITGLASLIAFAWTEDSLAVSRVAVLVLVFVISALVFLTLSVCLQAWRLFQEQTRDFQVVSFQKASIPDQGSDWVMQLAGPTNVDAGTVLQVDRVLSDGHEAPFALVQTTGRNSSGHHQATTIWLSPGALSDFRKSAPSMQQFRVDRYISLDCFFKAASDHRNG